jgi:Transposase family tnp2
VQPDTFLDDHARIGNDRGLSGSSDVISDAIQTPGDTGSSGRADDLDISDRPVDDPDHGSLDIPPGDVEDLWLQDTIHLNDLKTAAEFVKGLQGVTLDDPSLGMPDEALHRLRNPPHERSPVVIDKVTRLAIDLYLGNPSKETYETNCKAIQRYEPGIDLPSYYKIKRLVADVTGVESVMHHMCINSCLAYTGPFHDLDACPVCSEPRYDQFRLQTSSGKDKIPRKEFHTIPIGPQLQALYRSPESASIAHYLRNERYRIIADLEQTDCLDEYSDVLHGTDLIAAFQDGRIDEDAIVLMFSIDGAQLYAMKASACWIYIWVLLNLSPTERYKKNRVFVGGFIPGPNNPKNIDSFLFPGLQHLVALQKEGLRIWDAALQRELESKVFLALITADGPGMMHITGMVGYHGKHGCRLYCGMQGRREYHGKHYFPALLKPLNYDVPGCTHGDIDVSNLPTPSHEQYYQNLHVLTTSPNDSQYRARRLATGISRPSIFAGLDPSSTLGLPHSAGSDIMHLAALNLSDLMISMWRGTIDCTKPDDKSTWDWAVLRGDIWQQHGKAVEAALHYLPSSFDRPPRNIAEKLTSGYKAWEFVLYLYGLGPGILYGILPEKYFTNYCKLVLGIRLVNQHRITLSNVRDAHLALLSFAHDFELLYCQRLPTRIHFVRPCLHSLVHLPREVLRIGPPICSSQWTLERTIGNLGEEIKQHSNPFANLSQRGIRRAHVNALTAIIPDLDPNNSLKGALPRGSEDLKNGYVLLRARDKHRQCLRECEVEALQRFSPTMLETGIMSVRRWARLRIPNGQICYSAWKELQKPLEKRRTARNVKVSTPLL